MATLQPLGKNFQIVDEKGQPTDYFIRWAQQRQIDIGLGVTKEQAEALIAEEIAEFAQTQVIAGEGLSGGGPLTSDVTLNLNASINDLLDVEAEPDDADVLTWDEAEGLWVAKPSAGGGGGGLKYPQYRYWQVFATKMGGDNNYCALVGIELNDEAGINKAVPATATASGTLVGSPQRAFEPYGSDSGGEGWLSDGAKPATIEDDLGVSLGIAELVLVPFRNSTWGPVDFLLRGRDSVSAPWTTVLTVTGVTDWELGGVKKRFALPGVPVTYTEEAPIDGKIYGRKDATWTEVLSSGGGGGSVPIITAEAVTASPSSRWRMNVLNGAQGSTAVSIAEFQFRADAGIPEQNTGGTPSASSMLSSSYAPAYAFDTNPSTFWHNNLDLPCWLEYSFATARRVREVAIRQRSGYTGAQMPGTFDIEYYDGAVWKKALSVVNFNSWIANGAGLTLFPVDIPTVISMPEPTTHAGVFAMLTNSSRGYRPVYCDGTAWRFASDDAVVS